MLKLVGGLKIIGWVEKILEEEGWKNCRDFKTQSPLLLRLCSYLLL